MSKLRESVNEILTEMKEAKARNDKKAVNTLLLRLEKYTVDNLCLIAGLYLNNRYDARNCFCEAFEKVYLYVESYDSGKDGYNWLCTIVQKLAYNFNKERSFYVNIDEISYSLADKRYSETFLLENIELQNALEKLPPEDQTIVVCFAQAYSLQEIARKLRKPKGTVFYRLQKSLDELRKFLNK